MWEVAYVRTRTIWEDTDVHKYTLFERNIWTTITFFSYGTAYAQQCHFNIAHNYLWYGYQLQHVHYSYRMCFKSHLYKSFCSKFKRNCDLVFFKAKLPYVQIFSFFLYCTLYSLRFLFYGIYPYYYFLSNNRLVLLWFLLLHVYGWSLWISSLMLKSNWQFFFI